MKKKKVKTGFNIHLFISRLVVYIILAILSIMCLFCFYTLIINASRSNAELQGRFTLLPSSHFVENFKNAWSDPAINIPQGVLNSFIIAILSSALTVYFSALTAYGFHVYDFKFKKQLFVFIMAIMIIPAQVGVVGFVQMVRGMGLADSFIPLIVPSIAAPVVFFYMKQHMESTLPLEIIEAARVDGANEFYTFNTIILPLLKPAIAVQAIFSFVGSWNNYMVPALIIDNEKKRTVPMMMANLRSADYSKFDMGKVYMFILLAILPVLIMYLFLNKFIIKNVTEGAVKG